MSSKLSLGRHPLIRTRSLDEAVNLQTKLSASLKVEHVERRVPYHWDANRIQYGGIGVVVSDYGAGVRASSQGLGERFTLNLAARAGGGVKQGRQKADLVCGQRAALCSPGVQTEFTLASGYQGMTVGIPRQLLESALDALTGVARTEPLRFDLRVDLLAGGGAAARRLLDFIVREADLGTSPGEWPIVEDRLVEAFACMLLSGVPHNYSHLFAVAPTAKEPRYVRRVEEYIETNAHRHIALADLAATAGGPGSDADGGVPGAPGIRADRVPAIAALRPGPQASPRDARNDGCRGGHVLWLRAPRPLQRRLPAALRGTRIRDPAPEPSPARFATRMTRSIREAFAKSG
jgi:AraC-binding-like domain